MAFAETYRADPTMPGLTVRDVADRRAVPPALAGSLRSGFRAMARELALQRDLRRLNAAQLRDIGLNQDQM